MHESSRSKTLLCCAALHLESATRRYDVQTDIHRLYRKQKEYAKKIEPIRRNGHLLLVTLLLANMIVNESLPIIADPILGGGVQSVVVSTVLIVM